MSIPSSSKSHTLAWVLATLLSLVLYLASFGPVATYHRRSGQHFPPVLETLYTPVIWAWRNTPLKGPIYRYLQWCEDRMYGPVDIE